MVSPEGIRDPGHRRGRGEGTQAQDVAGQERVEAVLAPERARRRRRAVILDAHAALARDQRSLEIDLSREKPRDCARPRTQNLTVDGDATASERLKKRFFQVFRETRERPGRRRETKPTPSGLSFSQMTFTFTSKGVYSSPSSVGSVGSAASGRRAIKKRLLRRRSRERVGGG